MKRLLLSVVLLAIPGVSHTQDSTFDIAATVNEYQLSNWEAERELATIIGVGNFHQNFTIDQISAYRQQALDSLILKELKFQWVQKNAFVFDQESAKAVWQKTRAKFPTEEAYLEALDQAKISSHAAFFRAFVRDFAAEAIDVDIRSRVPAPAPKQVEEYFKTNQANYMSPEARHVIHLMVHVPPGGTPSFREKAEARADTLAIRARQGENLVDLAKAQSKDLPPRFKDLSGDLGFVHKGRLMSDLDEAIFSAQLDRITGPVVTLYGFHVFQVLKIRYPEPIPFESVKAGIKKRLEIQAQDSELSAFEESLHRVGNIRNGEWVSDH